jgi:hypothetical protein
MRTIRRFVNGLLFERYVLTFCEHDIQMSGEHMHCICCDVQVQVRDAHVLAVRWGGARACNVCGDVEYESVPEMQDTH